MRSEPFLFRSLRNQAIHREGQTLSLIHISSHFIYGKRIPVRPSDANHSPLVSIVQGCRDLADLFDAALQVALLGRGGSDGYWRLAGTENRHFGKLALSLIHI